MPQTTGLKRPQSETRVESNIGAQTWSPVANVRDANDATAASASGGNATALDAYSWHSFGLLAEDGGTIPAGATITKLTVTYQVEANVAASPLNNGRFAQVWGQVRKSPTGTPILTGTPSGHDTTLSAAAGSYGTRAESSSNVASQDNRVVTLTWNGTASSPQTTFTRSDLADGVLSVMLDADGGGVGGGLTHFAYWIKVEAEWVLVRTKAGTATAEESALAGLDRLENHRAGVAVSESAPAGSRKMVMASEGGLTVDNTMVATLKLVYNSKTGRAEAEGVVSGSSQEIKNRMGGHASDATVLSADHEVVGHVIKGVVTESGAPVSGVTVELYSTQSGDRVATTTTDATGTYKFFRRSDSGEHMVYAHRVVDAENHRFGATDRELGVEVEVLHA